jgi:hypothetical protein
MRHGARHELADPGSSVSVRDKNNQVEYLGYYKAIRDQISLATSFGSLSSRKPRKLGALILPSLVHSWNATSHTSLGFTHLTGALAFGFGVNGQVLAKYGLSRP